MKLKSTRNSLRTLRQHYKRRGDTYPNTVLQPMHLSILGKGNFDWPRFDGVLEEIKIDSV